MSDADTECSVCAAESVALFETHWIAATPESGKGCETSIEAESCSQWC